MNFLYDNRIIELQIFIIKYINCSELFFLNVRKKSEARRSEKQVFIFQLDSRFRGNDKIDFCFTPNPGAWSSEHKVGGRDSRRG